MIGLARELRRRRVLRTAALYVIGAWLVLQVADVLFPGFGIPDAAIRVLVWTAVLGFPLALVFGWFFDIGAGGIRRTPPASAEGARDPQPLNRVDLLILAAFVLVAGALVYNATEQVLETPVASAHDAATTRSDEPVPKLPNSIAVLAFDNISDDPGNETFCEGVSEEILNKLSGFRGLNVIGRTSSFAFKGSNFDIARISGLLGVHYVLQGSVRKYGEDLRIAAQLLDERGRQVWSQTFDRKLRNVFDIQTEIAEAVASRTASELVPSMASVRKPDIRAYEEYVAGRDLLRRRLPAAKDKLRRAVDLDPDFAEARAELAIALLLRNPPSKEAAAEAQENIVRALELNPGLLRARAAQGLASLAMQPPDYAEAERILREVLEQEPNMSDARLWLVDAIGGQGREDEAFEVLQRAAQLDPLHASIVTSLAQGFIERGEVDRAISLAGRQLEAPKPGFPAFLGLRHFYQYTGRLVDANRIAKSTALRLHGPQYYGLAESYAMLGQWAEVDYWLERSLRDFPTFTGNETFSAMGQYWRGRYDEAVRRFREAADASGFKLSDESSEFSLWFGALLARSGDYAAAIDLLEARVPADSPLGFSAPWGILNLDALHALAWSYIQTGETDSAAPLLAGTARQCNEFRDTGRLHFSETLHYCAENALLQGDRAQALHLLELAVKAGWRDYYIPEHDPYWAVLEDDARYRELMATVKADVDRQRAEVERIDANEDFVAKLDASLAEAAGGGATRSETSQSGTFGR
jgi:adenylate cyclase